MSKLVIIVVGMAGTGKTTLVHRLQDYFDSTGQSSYFMNLDPAVADVPYEVNIDIRDTVNYKEVMKQYRLGPNGAIMTSLNLFATKFHQVISILEKKDDCKYIVVDTPGQIEVFTWSASGQLIMEACGASFPTCLLFVGDATRCVNPQTFMSTMLYSSSILYKSQLPLILVLNKTDVVDGSFVTTWMKDPEALAEVTAHSKGYAATLTQSLGLFVREFYENLQVQGVSALTGAGISQLQDHLVRAKAEYDETFLPLLRQRAADRERAQASQHERLTRDIQSGE